MSLARARTRATARRSVEWLARRRARRDAARRCGAALAQAGYVGRRVTREMARAICLVGGGDCERDQRAVRRGLAARRAHGHGARLRSSGWARTAGADRASARTAPCAVTLEERERSGGEAGVGGDAQASHVGGRRRSAAAARSRPRAGPAAARPDVDRRLARPRRGGSPARRAPRGRRDATWSRRGADLVGRASARGGPDAFGAAARGRSAGRARRPIAHGGLARRPPHRPSHRVRRRRRRRRRLAAVGVLGLVGRPRRRDATRSSSTHDGRPLDLRVTATGRFAGPRDLPAVVQPVAGCWPRRRRGRRGC